MGNVSGREDGSDNSQSGVESGGAVGGAAPDSMADQDPVGGEFMGHSPPPSPRASHSPLMFRPQMPLVPLQRPEEMSIPSPSWMQTTSRHEDVCNEQGIPTMITWSLDGKEVAVEGSWDDWKTRKPLQRSGKDFTIMKVLPSGVYQYRFIVDGQWRYSPDLPWAQDESGNAHNILDLKDYVPEDIDNISGFEPPQSPDASYNNLLLGPEDYAKEPPVVPPHLQLTLLNAPAPQMEIPPPFSRPQHVVLNHLYMQKGRGKSISCGSGFNSSFPFQIRDSRALQGHKEVKSEICKDRGLYYLNVIDMIFNSKCQATFLCELWKSHVRYFEIYLQGKYLGTYPPVL